MWDLRGPGLEPVSPALAGRFLTTAPPGKSKVNFLTKYFVSGKGGFETIREEKLALKREEKSGKVRIRTLKLIHLLHNLPRF